MKAEKLLLHLRVVEQTRELVGALRKFAQQGEPLDFLPDFTRATKQKVDKRRRDSLSENEAAVTLLVLKSVDAPLHRLCKRDAAFSDSILQHIREVVFGKVLEPQSLMALVYSQSFSQAVLARDLCIIAAGLILKPENCFSILQLAEAYSLPSLQACAFRVACRGFNSAVTSNTEGFAALTLQQLLAVLGSNELQVSSELEVFRCIIRWIGEQEEARKPHLGRLLREGARLELMEKNMLAEIDAHPLVVYNKEASALVAKAYMHCCYGSFLKSVPVRRSRKAAPSSIQSPGEGSIGSCSATGAAEPPSSSAKRPDKAVVAGSSELVGLSCAKSRLCSPEKRRRLWLTPGRLATPSVRLRRVCSVAPNADLSQLGFPMPPPKQSDGARRPSKRRLFD